MKKTVFCFSSLFLLVFAATCTSTPGGPGPRYLFPDDYMADPSAHVFNGRLYIYPSHDRNSSGYMGRRDNGGEYDMVDYHVFSLDDVFYGEVTDHGVVLSVRDIPWAGGQLWAPDAAHKDGRYYLYFPAKDKEGIFKIGVATADRPEGPFVSEPEPIRGSYSIDPCVFEDNGDYYMYFGGIWGGQLQLYNGNNYEYSAGRANGSYNLSGSEIISPRVAKMSGDMLQFAENPRELVLLGANGRPLTNGNNGSRFFEAAWMHKYNGMYYFSYSTGDTHKICYATGDNPYGPFTYQGVILTEVAGWTSHHSIVEFNGEWYLFYHDARHSGQNNLRKMKAATLTHLPDGSIRTISGMAR